MSEQFGQIKAARPSFLRGLSASGWNVGALVIALLVLMPIGAVVWFALTPTENIWPHLLATTLPRYASNTVILMVGVGLLAAGMGAGAAWLVVMYRFAGVKWLQWALLMPLAVPAYVGAYALVDFLDYAGPVQTGLRSLFGWQDARSYWFPHVRSRTGAVFVLASALYPYVYILARAAFKEQSGAGYDVARALGVGPWGRFFRVGLPLARPAIVAGTAVVMMETVNDFGTVDYFAVQTLTTGIFSVWLQAGNLGGAAQISVCVLGVIILLVTLEKISRRRSRFFAPTRGMRPVTATILTGWQSWLATIACLIPLTLGFILPTWVIISHATNADVWLAPGLARALWHSLSVGGIAAVLTVAGAVFMVYGVRLGKRKFLQVLMPVTAIGYAAPGAVLGLGVLVPLAAFDNRLADWLEAMFDIDSGLLLTGTAFALVLAYCVRFFAIAQGTAEAALGRVAPHLPMAARSLGRTAGGTLSAVYLPLVKGSLGSALLLVFVDCVKELPATLLLRPFNYDTLATRVYDKASLENLTDAAPAALVITAVGLVAVTLLARASR